MGCALGASLQSFFAFDSRGFEFALVALFLMLLIEQIHTMRERWLLAVALVVSILTYATHPVVLLVAISLCLAMLVVRLRSGGMNDNHYRYFRCHGGRYIYYPSAPICGPQKAHDHPLLGRIGKLCPP